MTITLTPEQEAIVREKMASGRFTSPDAVIAEALRRLEHREDPLPLDDLRREVDVAIAEEERGETADLNIEEILAKGRTALAERQKRR
jgi:putative addiction module CopG family antidote